MSSKYLIAVVGPTASGKTTLGIDLARYYKTEIISADSRQIYKGLYIGTVQPTIEERSLAKHHLIDFVDLDRYYTVADYERDSLYKIKLLFETRDVLIMVGGTGLYINSVCNGLDKIPSVPYDIKNEVDEMYTRFGLSKCVDELKKYDVCCGKYIDLNNRNRVIRALCVVKATGRPIYSFFKTTDNKRCFKTVYVGLNLDKEILLNRINTRVDNMIKCGLVDEASRFIQYRNCNSLQTIGYKEVYEYLDNPATMKLNDLIFNIKVRTRQYAKRQMTWFRKNKDIMWFDNLESNKIIIESISNKIRL